MNLKYKSRYSFQYISMRILRLKCKDHLLIMMKEKFPNQLTLIDGIDILGINKLYVHPSKASSVITKNYSGPMK